CGSGGLLGLRGRGIGGADDRQHGADLGVLVLLDADLEHGARDGGGDLGVDLVGRDLEQRLVDLDGLADGLEPAGDGALGDGLAERRHRHLLALCGATGGSRRLGRGRLGGGSGLSGRLLGRLLGRSLGCGSLLGGRLGAGVVGAREAEPEPSPMTTRSAPTSASSSSSTRIFSIVPATGEGISVSTLSVETSSSGSSTSTVSPTAL